MYKFPLILASLAVMLTLAYPPMLAAQDASGSGASQNVRTQSDARTEIERERKQAEEQAQQSLDQDAATAIEDTRKAADSLAQGQQQEALSAIKRATGKIDTLVARAPAKGLVPVAAEVTLIDLAPMNVKAIRDIAGLAEKAVNNRDYPAARLLLDTLQSEIHIRTTHLPLASYPAALKEAARLIDQKKPGEARTVLLIALHTLVIIDRVLPVPVITAQLALAVAEEQRDKNRDEALLQLAIARNELERARELGYAGKDAEYADLNKAITDLEKQVKSKGNSASGFSALKEKLRNFFKRHSEEQKQSAPASGQR